MPPRLTYPSLSTIIIVVIVILFLIIIFVHPIFISGILLFIAPCVFLLIAARIRIFSESTIYHDEHRLDL